MDHEAAIRAYLTYLEDPGKLRDEREVQRLTNAVLAAEDPIDKLKALAELKRAAQVDGDALRADFVAAAKPWAEEAGVPAAAFAELGVPDDVLVEAGFELPPRPRRGGRRAGGERAAGTRQRSAPVPASALKDAIRQRRGTFVLNDLVAEHAASPGTVRKAVEELIASGEVEKLGPDPDHRARGRAPLRYQVIVQG